MSKGFIYLLSNPSIPGLVKIGFSRKVPTERALELDTTGVPTPFVVEYYCLVNDAAPLESKIHQKLDNRRLRKGREFFRMDVSEALSSLKEIIKEPEHSWSREVVPPARPAMVECTKCGAKYVIATHCPKCRIKLEW